MSKKLEEGFHVGGLYFARTPDGGVQVTNGLIRLAVMSASEWASVVASVSLLGDNATTFSLAETLHRGPA